MMSLEAKRADMTAESTSERITSRDFFLPLLIIGGLMLLVMTMGTHFAVRAFDRASEEREQILAHNGFNQRIKEVAQMIVPQTDWDEAIRHLDNQFDQEWADDNIGKYFHQSNGFERSFILDKDNQPIYGSQNSERIEPQRYLTIADKVTPLINDIRQQEARRAPLVPSEASNMISKPIQASALKAVDGQIAIVTATLVQPDFGTALPSGPHSPIVVTVMQIDPAFLELFSKRYLLQNLTIRQLDEPKIASNTEIPVRDDSNAVLAYFTWQPLNPGYAMLRQFLPPISVIGLILIVIAITQLRRMQRFANDLILREAHSHHIASHDALTGLPNEAYLHDKLQQEIANLTDGKGFALHLVQIDRFQRLRDSIGPDASDDLLCAVSWKLQDNCPPTAFIARHGVGMFAIMLPAEESQMHAYLAEKLQDALSDSIQIPEREGSVDMWIGSVDITAQAHSSQAAIRQAEEALHKARRSGPKQGSAPEVKLATA